MEFMCVSVIDTAINVIFSLVIYIIIIIIKWSLILISFLFINDFLIKVLLS